MNYDPKWLVRNVRKETFDGSFMNAVSTTNALTDLLSRVIIEISSIRDDTMSLGFFALTIPGLLIKNTTFTFRDCDNVWIIVVRVFR